MKTKSIKRIGAVILAIAMLLGMNLTGVLAATDDSGRDPSKDVSLTIYKYESNEELSFPVSDGTKLEDSDIPTGAKPVPGVTFKIEKVTLKSGVTTGLSNPANYEPVTGTGAFSTTGTTDEDGKVVFSTVAANNTADDELIGQGIYRITEVKSATAGTAAIADFIVSLPMANPDAASAESWLYDVYAYPKNDVQKTIDKEVVEKETNSNIITWKYSVIIPEDIDTPLTGAESLVITDELDYRLKYLTDSIQGTYTTRDGTVKELDFEDDYKLEIAENPIQVLTISITENGFAKLADAYAATGSETPMMYFTFQTKTNIGSTVSDLGEIDNGGELNYTNSAGHKYDKEEIEDPDKPKTDVYGIKIYKINVNNEVLAGAKFNIYTSQTAAEAKDTTQALTKPDGTTWEVATDDDGYAYFYGLAEGTYYLVETEAPTGYNPLSAPIEVVISAGTGGTIGADRTVQVTVTNSKGFELPKTGGMGTILFTAGGLLLIGSAVVFLVLSKRRKTKEG